MRCDDFKIAIQSEEPSAETLEHLRNCADCLDFAAEINPDNLFRSLGGDDLVPPGGIDQFTAEVMQQVTALERIRLPRQRAQAKPGYVWSLAAALGVAVMSFALVNGRQDVAAPVPAVAKVNRPVIEEVATGLTAPVIEEYENSSAMIVEVPVQETGGVQVVMIFDESLPADL